MTKQVRDWHKEQQQFMAVDGKRMEEDAECIIISLEGFHSLLAEKERADRLEEKLNHKTNLLRVTDVSRDEAREMYRNAVDFAAQEQERADKQQAAIKEALDAWEAMDAFDDPLDTVEKMINLLRPFYPKEEEAK